MSRGTVVVVGSGASALHFARTALELDHEVLMLDLGHQRPEQPFPELDLNELKRQLEDPPRWFLGDRFGSLVLPGADGEYYGFPPSKEYVFREPGPETTGPGPMNARGFAPLSSFAAGGLAEAWTGGSYPLNEGELKRWPIGLQDLLPWYGEVARRIGITGAMDDLGEYFPEHGGMGEPLDLDAHGQALMDAYEVRRDDLWRRHRVRMGRARLAVLSADREGRGACDHLGRCLWGCPRDSLWTPAVGLEELRRHPAFRYRDGVVVRSLEVGDGGRLRALNITTGSGAEEQVTAERVALAAGALGSARFLLRTFQRVGGHAPELSGLMDNRQILMPFVNLGMLGRPFEPRSYQYNQLAVGLVGEEPFDYVHGLVTTLKTALVHPIVQNLPFGMAASLRTFRDIHGALGLLNVNYPDVRRSTNTVALHTDADGGDQLLVRYEADPTEGRLLRRTTRTLRRALRKLGCLAPSAMTHVRPMGASVHYAGLVPMSEASAPHTSTPEGQSRDFPDVFLVDGIGFPSLPAKNLTFTLMANASRIADLQCR